MGKLSQIADINSIDNLWRWLYTKVQWCKFTDTMVVSDMILKTICIAFVKESITKAFLFNSSSRLLFNNTYITGSFYTAWAFLIKVYETIKINFI